MGLKPIYLKIMYAFLTEQIQLIVPNCDITKADLSIPQSLTLSVPIVYP